LGLVIVHHHGVQAQHHHRRLSQLEPPQEQLSQEPAEEEGPGEIESPEKPLDLVRAQQLVGCGFEDRGVAGVFFKPVEMDEMAAGPVRKKAEELREGLLHRKTLGTFFQSAEQLRDRPPKLDALEVAREQRQPAPSGESFGAGFDAVDGGFAWGEFHGILIHSFSPPFWLNSWLMRDFYNYLILP